MVRAFVMVLALQMGQSLLAAEANSVQWFNDVNQAWQASQRDGRPLLVFVTRGDCIPCARMKLQTYADRRVASTINARYVALVVTAEQASPLIKELAVNAYPATFIISPQAVILQRIDGYVTPDELTKRLANMAKTPAVPVNATTGVY
jgi:thioredoxin-related protein